MSISPPDQSGSAAGTTAVTCARSLRTSAIFSPG